MNALQVLALINGALTIINSASVSIARYRVLLETAQAEGRDITDAELAELKAESDKLTEETLARLETPGGDQSRPPDKA